MEASIDRARMLEAIPSFKGEYFTSVDLAAKTGVARATALAFSKCLERLGFLDRTKVAPSHLFIWREGERSPEAKQFLAAIDSITSYHDRRVDHAPKAHANRKAA